MKILYVITKSNWGGAQKHVYDLATAMKARGHEVKVALGGEGALKERLESVGVFTYPISALGRDISVGKDAGSFKEIFSVVKAQRPDVLHLHSPKAAGLGALAGRLLGIKNIVMTVHGFTFNEDRPFYEKLSIRFFSWLTAVLCHKVIVISRREYDQARAFPYVKEKIVLIPLGLRPAALMSVDGAKQFLGKLIDTDVVEFNKKSSIGTIAELHPNKGLPYLIEAISLVAGKYPHAICIVIGDGQDKAALGALIKENKLEQRVFLVGQVENASDYLKAFNVFVLPSVKEGLPYTLLEAGAASLPVVATTVGGIPELVEDMKSGILVQPKNARELAHALSFMIEHPDERRSYGAALREKVLKDYSMEKMIASIEDVCSKTQ